MMAFALFAVQIHVSTKPCTCTNNMPRSHIQVSRGGGLFGMLFGRSLPAGDKAPEGGSSSVTKIAHEAVGIQTHDTDVTKSPESLQSHGEPAFVVNATASNSKTVELDRAGEVAKNKAVSMPPLDASSNHAPAHHQGGAHSHLVEAHVSAWSGSSLNAFPTEPAPRDHEGFSTLSVSYASAKNPAERSSWPRVRRGPALAQVSADDGWTDGLLFRPRTLTTPPKKILSPLRRSRGDLGDRWSALPSVVTWAVCFVFLPIRDRGAGRKQGCAFGWAEKERVESESKFWGNLFKLVFSLISRSDSHSAPQACRKINPRRHGARRASTADATFDDLLERVFVSPKISEEFKLGDGVLEFSVQASADVLKSASQTFSGAEATVRHSAIVFSNGLTDVAAAVEAGSPINAQSAETTHLLEAGRGRDDSGTGRISSSQYLG